MADLLSSSGGAAWVMSDNFNLTMFAAENSDIDNQMNIDADGCMIDFEYLDETVAINDKKDANTLYNHLCHTLTLTYVLMPLALTVTKYRLPPLSVATQQARLFSMPHPERATLNSCANTLQPIMLNRLWFMPT